MAVGEASYADIRKRICTSIQVPTNRSESEEYISWFKAFLDSYFSRFKQLYLFHSGKTCKWISN